MLLGARSSGETILELEMPALFLLTRLLLSAKLMQMNMELHNGDLSHSLILGVSSRGRGTSNTPKKQVLLSPAPFARKFSAQTSGALHWQPMQGHPHKLLGELSYFTSLKRGYSPHKPPFGVNSVV